MQTNYNHIKNEGLKQDYNNYIAARLPKITSELLIRLS